VIATVEVAAGVWIVGPHGEIYAAFFVFVAMFAGYAFSDRRAIAAHVALASAALALPLTHLHGDSGETLARTVVGVLLLVMIAGVVTLLREGLQTRQAEFQELTLRDPLTGVGNYRLLSERLVYEIARHGRSGRALTIMLLDLDGFKQINDTFGHLIGDRVLSEVARALATAVRAQDTLARHGGDEFSILAPETDDAHAGGLAARACDAIAATASGSVPASVGWVTYPRDGRDPATLLALADAKLRDAKRDHYSSHAEIAAPTRAAMLRLIENDR
jgi:diguanylate cyclase (GGDEF)-like protein